MSGLQHFIIIRIDRNIGMHIAVTRMHMQSDEYSLAQNIFMNGF